MMIDPGQLLKKLEPAVRPGTAPARAGEAGSPFEQKGFDELLALVSTGAMADGLPVHPRAGVVLDEPLEPEQLNRLAAAADMAAANGAERAILIIDGRGLVLDVARRELTAEMTDSSTNDLVEIDVAVYVAATDGTTRSGGAPPLPGNGLMPPGIAKHFRSAPATTHSR